MGAFVDVATRSLSSLGPFFPPDGSTCCCGKIQSSSLWQSFLGKSMTPRTLKVSVGLQLVGGVRSVMAPVQTLEHHFYRTVCVWGRIQPPG